MESGDLRIFRCVAQEGNMTKAAERLGYVQSNVTARIRQLETELGTALFIRHNRGMTLTPAGELLLTYAVKTIGILDEAVQALQATDQPSGPLRIGSTQTAAAVRLPKLFSQYYNTHPHVSLSLSTGNSLALMDQVAGYELDGAFIGCPCDRSELEAIPVFNEQLFVISAVGNGGIEELATKPILVYSYGCSYREILENWLKEQGNRSPVIMEFGTLEAIISGVASGMGISLLPLLVVQRELASGTIRAQALPKENNTMMTYFITRKNSFKSSALHAFIDLILQHAQPHEAAANGDEQG
ncbi:LysR family transcriptional regulator [Paenibacillus oryzae]|uniref:LysR family transcriptional regulator n=1 Tax=Paenibacillus oryzae TaxID=1844972 RepID=A0A1A5YFY8_9BACL|nr:LysR family transcriptional regulator [Paenibacillus oryzae]OBR64315.1 LysR family transcriptional regulator [Paenibacillus oryzae]